MKDVRNEKRISSRVTGIEWERILLRLRVKVEPDRGTIPDDLEFYAVGKAGLVGAYFEILGVEDGEYTLYVNVTNNGRNACVPTATYSIMVVSGDELLAECETDEALTPYMDSLSRNFLYSSFRKSYNVNFYVEDDSETLPFRMNVVNTANASMGFPGGGTVGGRIKGIFRDFVVNQKPNIRRLYALIRWIYRGSRPTNILFITEQTGTLGSNLTSIIDRMKERGLDGKYRIFTWSVKRVRGNHNIIQWWQKTVLFGKCGIVFCDDHVPTLDWMKLSDDTKVIQTWHAGAGFKSSGYSRWGHSVCGSRKIAHFFSEVWGINTENVLNTGMPRMDEYQTPEHRQKATEEIYGKYPVLKDKRVILFAPTYRGTNNSNAYYPYDLIDWKRLDEITGDGTAVLFKMHPWVIKPVNIPKKYRNKFIDVQKYPNINDLFYVTDLLITDYSSNIYEYSLMRKPMLFFAYDEIQYSFSRGFHRPYRESAPGKVCTTFAELCDAIEHEDYEYEKVEKYINEQFDHFDNKACDRVIDWLLEGELPADIRAAIDARQARVDKMYDRKLQFQELIGTADASLEEESEASADDDSDDMV